MPSTDLVQKHLSILDIDHPLVVGFHIGNNANGDSWKNILVFYTADAAQVSMELPEGVWRVVASKHEVNELGVTTPGLVLPMKSEVKIPVRSILILVDSESI